MQSQNNPTYGSTLHPIKSVAARQEEVSLLLAQSDRPEHRPVTIESASEVDTHKAEDGRYLKEIYYCLNVNFMDSKAKPTHCYDHTSVVDIREDYYYCFFRMGQNKTWRFTRFITWFFVFLTLHK